MCALKLSTYEKGLINQSKKYAHRLCVCGVSGIGKSSIVQHFIKHKGYQFLITTTTRKIRTYEQNFIDFYFVTREKFEMMIKNEELVEYMEYLGNYYGLTKNELKRTQNINTVLNLSPYQGIKDKVPNTIWILLTHKDKEEIKRRIIERDKNLDPLIVQERLRSVDSYQPESNFYDIEIDVSEKTVQQICDEITYSIDIFD